MATERAFKEPVSIDADWRQRVKTEERVSKRFDGEWGFLSGKLDLTSTGQRPRGISPAKYYGTGGGWIVRQKTLPDLSSQKRQQLEEQEEAPNMRGPTGHLTARSSTRLSHSLRLGELSRTQGMYSTSSKAYGSRLPIEQFGVAHHGIQSSAITNRRLL